MEQTINCSQPLFGIDCPSRPPNPRNCKNAQYSDKLTSRSTKESVMSLHVLFSVKSLKTWHFICFLSCRNIHRDAIDDVCPVWMHRDTEVVLLSEHGRAVNERITIKVKAAYELFSMPAVSLISDMLIDITC